MKSTVLVLAVLVTGSPLVPGQTAPSGNADPISQGIRQGWDQAKRNIKESADLMPEADYAFKPVDSVRTFGQILAHVAGADYVFCAAAKGEASPRGEADFEKTAKTKAEIVKALGESLAYCDTAYTALDDKRAAERVDLPFGMGRGARARVLMMNIEHVTEHYGNLVTYFRIKGMVPPSSRRR